MLCANLRSRAVPISGKLYEGVTASCRSPARAHSFPSDFVSQRCTFQAPEFWGRKGLLIFSFSPLLSRGRGSFTPLTMHTYKHWKATAVDALRQEPDRPRHKPFAPLSLSRHKTPEIRASAREREDSKRRSGRGYVSDGPLPSSQTPVPTYPTGAQSLATASKASHNAHTQPSQGYPAHVSQKASIQNTPLPQESLPTTQRYSEATPDPRATFHRTIAASDKVPPMPPDSTRHVEGHRKASRHRHRQHPTPALESAEPQPASTWPLPTSFFKKASPEVREREKERSRNRLTEESKANVNAKDKGRTERTQEHASRDQRERDPRYEEERRHYKEERPREKERQREEEQHHDERHQEQKAREDYVHKSTRDQERRRETRDGHVPVTSVGKDPRLIRVAVKDSDESDNSLMKPSGLIRPRRRHPKDQTTTVSINDVPKTYLTWGSLGRCSYCSASANTCCYTRTGSNGSTREQPCVKPS